MPTLQARGVEIAWSERGRGSPIVLIPGLQGRWEWMMPAVDALSARHRTFSFSLNDSDAATTPERAFDLCYELNS